MRDIAALIRTIPDFPQPGIMFKDITPLLADPTALSDTIALLAHRYRSMKLDKIVAVESRGFIFGAPLACALGVGFVPARKPGKLPYKTIEESYALEYGTNTIAMHEDAIAAGERVLVLDDLIATGGTLEATCRLVERLGGVVAEVACIVELTFLNGREKLPGRPVHSMIQF
jgi:adenine phosphoribosyltransferase